MGASKSFLMAHPGNRWIKNSAGIFLQTPEADQDTEEKFPLSLSISWKWWSFNSTFNSIHEGLNPIHKEDLGSVRLLSHLAVITPSKET